MSKIDINISDIEKAALEILSKKGFYPRYCGNGLWELSKGVFTNKIGYSTFWYLLYKRTIEEK